jgi:hypothetical protein
VAIILSDLEIIEAFISGTTSRLVGSIRQAEELSITVVPASANRGAISFDMLPPAEKMAIAGLAAMASSMPITVSSRPLKLQADPTDLSEATTKTSSAGKFLSARIFKISPPTRPVAPTTAIFMKKLFRV